MQTDSYFNLALVPESVDLIELCTNFARQNCLQNADAYLLGDAALPHVTLCQFNAPESRLDEIWNVFDDVSARAVELRFINVYIKYGKGALSGKSWIGLSVKPESHLIDLQKDVFSRLERLGVHGRNRPTDYFPHLTFARCDASKPAVIAAVPEEDFWSTQYPFLMTVGHSDEHGRYRETARGRR